MKKFNNNLRIIPKDINKNLTAKPIGLEIRPVLGRVPSNLGAASAGKNSIILGTDLTRYRFGKQVKRRKRRELAPV